MTYCTRVKIGDVSAIVCHGGKRPKRCGCGRESTKACDWIIGRRGKRVLRCSAPLCDSCAVYVGPDKDLCPPHGTEWSSHPSNPHRVGAP